jgi:hypothetical protein
VESVTQNKKQTAATAIMTSIRANAFRLDLSRRDLLIGQFVFEKSLIKQGFCEGKDPIHCVYFRSGVGFFSLSSRVVTLFVPHRFSILSIVVSRGSAAVSCRPHSNRVVL